jgi:hypothetical protein
MNTDLPNWQLANPQLHQIPKPGKDYYSFAQNEQTDSIIGRHILQQTIGYTGYNNEKPTRGKFSFCRA